MQKTKIFIAKEKKVLYNTNVMCQKWQNAKKQNVKA